VVVGFEPDSTLTKALRISPASKHPPDLASWKTAFCTGINSLSSCLSLRPSSRKNSLRQIAMQRCTIQAAGTFLEYQTHCRSDHCWILYDPGAVTKGAVPEQLLLVACLTVWSPSVLQGASDGWPWHAPAGPRLPRRESEPKRDLAAVTDLWPAAQLTVPACGRMGCQP